jgi:hypothetical protein
MRKRKTVLVVEEHPPLRSFILNLLRLLANADPAKLAAAS